MEQLQQLLKTYPEVEQASLDLQWVKRLHAILHFTATVVKSLMLSKNLELLTNTTIPYLLEDMMLPVKY